MTRAELIAHAAKRAGLPRSDIARVLDAMLSLLTETLRTGDSVSFSGFEKFSTSDRSARLGVNPRTGVGVVEIAALRVAKFSAGTALKRAVKTSGSGGSGGSSAPTAKAAAQASTSSSKYVVKARGDTVRKAQRPTTRKARRMLRNGGGGGGTGAGVVAANGAESDTSRKLRRTPHLDISGKQPLARGARFEVVVWADSKDPRRGETSQPIEIETPEGVRRVTLTVWLSISDHFEWVDDVRLKPMTIDVDAEESSQVLFPLRVRRAQPIGDGAPTITAFFAYRTRGAGSVGRRVRVQRSDPSTSGPRKRYRRLPPGRLSARTDTRAADLTVHVTSVSPATRPRWVTYGCTVFSPLLAEYREGVTGEWPLPDDTAAYLEEQMREFTDPGAGDRQRVGRLLSAGKELFLASPPIFQDVYWSLHKAGKRVNTISIESIEPHIPWELMVPHRPGRRREDPLGVGAAVGRWLLDTHEAAEQTIALKDSLVLAPEYATLDRLTHAADEAKFVRRLFPPGILVDPANYTRLDQALSAGGAPLVHFVGHGDQGGKALMLAKEEDKCVDGRLSVSDLGDWNNAKLAFERQAPLVFLNACEVGRMSPSLVGTNGLAQAFAKLGASCIIAPIWSVDDLVAYDVAREFYKAVTSPRKRPLPMATILQRIRRRAYDGRGSDSHAAYCFFGDPRAIALTAARSR